ncbi:MAG: relaxase/mobilization nuclease domain-containing protein [Absicoccus porci]|uniref:relaxase/mobilization nuclease domain-containing protein n=1 Tax=Absicoccus porci TaxID=2486576 RepID=UPI002E75C6C4|nr:relaxase/mobilization nuclease domain-containing protein [Absicoccus porci]MEE1354441.1 relaxase/mobilization nuclease domain-containing protein [Absicoccus porci]
MAITKMWAIKKRLDTALKYIDDDNKTIDAALQYVSRNEATENKRYVTCINCSLDSPYEDMMNTKRIFHKADSKRLAYHAVQSFKPGEGNADTIHEIGVKLAEELYGDRYEIVITTHLDKDHLHNHIIINSTSFQDGTQFTNTKSDRNRLVQVSDRLCREYGLETIENPKKGRSVNYYKNRNFIDEIKKDFDHVIKHSCSLNEVYSNMCMEGYDFKALNGIDCIIHPGCIEPIPLHMLGKKYSNEKMKETIHGLDEHKPISYRPLNELWIDRNNTSGLRRIYVRWMFEFGILPQYQVKHNRLSPEIRKELKKLDRISEEVSLMGKHKIESMDDLKSARYELKDRLDELSSKRKGLYSQGKKKESMVDREVIHKQARDLTPEIKELRYQIKLLDEIESRSIRFNKQVNDRAKKKERER